MFSPRLMIFFKVTCIMNKRNTQKVFSNTYNKITEGEESLLSFINNLKYQEYPLLLEDSRVYTKKKGLDGSSSVSAESNSCFQNIFGSFPSIQSTKGRLRQSSSPCVPTDSHRYSSKQARAFLMLLGIVHLMPLKLMKICDNFTISLRCRKR